VKEESLQLQVGFDKMKKRKTLEVVRYGHNPQEHFDKHYEGGNRS